jgi:hypothetical protein
MRSAYKILVGKSEGNGGEVDDLGVKGKIILEWISGKQDEMMLIGYICIKIGTSDVLL